VPRWKSSRFEKLTAAIQAAECRGAAVKWNEFIKGRQFDVTIRGSDPDGNYLTVIECKDSHHPIPVKEVEAFTTKSRDAGASRAVMVSASGFQKGARRVAEAHGIELLELTEVEEIPERFLEAGSISALNISRIRIREPAGRVLVLPNSQELLELIVKSSVVNVLGKTLSLQQIFDQLNKRFEECATTEEQDREITFPEGSRIRLAGEQEGWIDLERIVVALKRVFVRQLKAPGVDPIVFERSYNIRNSVTGEARTVSGWDINHGFTTELRAGNFYRDPNLRVNYACLEVGDEDAKLVHLETEQHFMSFMATMVGSKEMADQLVPIDDPVQIARLEKLLGEYLSAVKENEGGAESKASADSVSSGDGRAK